MPAKSHTTTQSTDQARRQHGSRSGSAGTDHHHTAKKSTRHKNDLNRQSNLIIETAAPCEQPNRNSNEQLDNKDPYIQAWSLLLVKLVDLFIQATKALKGHPLSDLEVDYLSWLDSSIQESLSLKKRETAIKAIEKSTAQFLEQFTCNTLQDNHPIQSIIRDTRQILKKFNLMQALQQILRQITRLKAQAEASEALCQTEQHYDGTLKVTYQGLQQAVVSYAKIELSLQNQLSLAKHHNGYALYCRLFDSAHPAEEWVGLIEETNRKLIFYLEQWATKVQTKNLNIEMIKQCIAKCSTLSPKLIPPTQNIERHCGQVTFDDPSIQTLTQATRQWISPDTIGGPISPRENIALQKHDHSAKLGFLARLIKACKAIINFFSTLFHTISKINLSEKEDKNMPKNVPVQPDSVNIGNVSEPDLVNIGKDHSYPIKRVHGDLGRCVSRQRFLWSRSDFRRAEKRQLEIINRIHEDIFPGEWHPKEPETPKTHATLGLINPSSKPPLNRHEVSNRREKANHSPNISSFLKPEFKRAIESTNDTIDKINAKLNQYPNSPENLVLLLLLEWLTSVQQVREPDEDLQKEVEKYQLFLTTLEQDSRLFYTPNSVNKAMNQWLKSIQADLSTINEVIQIEIKRTTIVESSKAVRRYIKNMIDKMFRYTIRIMANSELRNFDLYGNTPEKENAYNAAAKSKFGKVLLAVHKVHNCLQKSINDDSNLTTSCNELEQECKNFQENIQNLKSDSGIADILINTRQFELIFELIRVHIDLLKLIGDYCKLYYTLEGMKNLADHGGGQAIYITHYSNTDQFIKIIIQANSYLDKLINKCQEKTNPIKKEIGFDSNPKARDWAHNNYFEANGRHIKQLKEDIKKCNEQLKNLQLSQEEAEAKYGHGTAEKIEERFLRFVPELGGRYLDPALKSSARLRLM